MASADEKMIFYTQTRVSVEDSCPPPQTHVFHTGVDTAESGVDAGLSRKVGCGDSMPDDLERESREKCQPYEMHGVDGEAKRVSHGEFDRLVGREDSRDLGSRGVNPSSPGPYSAGEPSAMRASTTYSSERNRAGGDGDLLGGDPGNTQRLELERQAVAGALRRKQKENS